MLKYTDPGTALRVVTATSLFDGHDASINIFRRILQSTGVEVIHLGHNRSVQEIVDAAIQEDAQGIAISSYQGGHVEFFKYMVDLLKDNGGADAHQGVRRRRRRHRSRGDQSTGSLRRQPRSIRRKTAPAWACRGSSTTWSRPWIFPGLTDGITRDLSGLTPDNKLPGGQPDHHPGAGQGPGKRPPFEQISAGTESPELADRAKVPVIGITGTGGAGKVLPDR
jgi:methylmalonyl-CoA mutase